MVFPGGVLKKPHVGCSGSRYGANALTNSVQNDCRKTLCEKKTPWGGQPSPQTRPGASGCIWNMVLGSKTSNNRLLWRYKRPKNKNLSFLFKTTGGRHCANILSQGLYQYSKPGFVPKRLAVYINILSQGSPQSASALQSQCARV